jgi:hypothetical protein
MRLSLTVAGAVQDSHLFPERLAASAHDTAAGGCAVRLMKHMQNRPLLLDAA